MTKAIYTPIDPQGKKGGRRHVDHSHKRLLSLIKSAVYGASLGVILCGATVSAQSSKDNDAEPKVQGSRAFNPVYPYEALMAGRGGSAEISFTVDYSGRAMLPSTVAASDPAFAGAFQADIEAIEFIPPRKNGRTMLSQLTERYVFLAEPKLDATAKQILVELRKPKPAIYTVAELDKVPEPIRQPPPAYPWILRSDGISGQAEIEFVIDRTGRPLFPHVISATHDDFGWAAATAILRWRYQPPVKNGYTVDVLFKETVVFDFNKAKDMW